MLFDRRYFNFGVVGENFFTGPGRTFGPAAGADPRVEHSAAPVAPAWLVAGRSVFVRTSRAQRSSAVCWIDPRGAA